LTPTVCFGFGQFARVPGSRANGRTGRRRKSKVPSRKSKVESAKSQVGSARRARVCIRQTHLSRLRPRFPPRPAAPDLASLSGIHELRKPLPDFLSSRAECLAVSWVHRIRTREEGVAGREPPAHGWNDTHGCFGGAGAGVVPPPAPQLHQRVSVVVSGIPAIPGSPRSPASASICVPLQEPRGSLCLRVLVVSPFWLRLCCPET
jgi:hypothetical protein